MVHGVARGQGWYVPWLPKWHDMWYVCECTKNARKIYESEQRTYFPLKTTWICFASTILEIFCENSWKGVPISLLAPGARKPYYTTGSLLVIIHCWYNNHIPNTLQQNLSLSNHYFIFSSRIVLSFFCNLIKNRNIMLHDPQNTLLPTHTCIQCKQIINSYNIKFYIMGH